MLKNKKVLIAVGSAILAVLLVATVVIILVVSSCNKKPTGGSSSKKPSSTITEISSTDGESSEIAESDPLGGDIVGESSYWPYPWTIETDSAYFRDDPMATQSVSNSESVKVYKNPSNIGLMCWSLSARNTNAYGNDKGAKLRYFKDIVDQGYFNQYMISGSDLDEIKIIAESGGSFWIMSGNDGYVVENNLDGMIEGIELTVNNIKEAGYGDLINGFLFDEPLLGGDITNSQFLKLTKALYQKFGLRINSVFSTYEFTGVESNSAINPDSNAQVVLPETLKYHTDVGFDAYSTDVRDGAPNGGPSKFAEWQANCSPDVVDGKSFYTEHRKLLQKKAGHPVNFWHYPCAWTDFLWGGLNGQTHADEAYWIAHLDFMAQDLLEQEYPGGLCLYTFRRTNADTNEAFERHMDLKTELGNWAVYPDVPKYEEYCKKLRDWCEVFSSKKINPVKTIQE